MLNDDDEAELALLNRFQQGENKQGPIVYVVTNTSYETFNGKDNQIQQPGILNDLLGLIVLAVLAGALLMILYSLTKNGGGFCRVNGTNDSDSESESLVYSTTDIEASSYAAEDLETQSYQDLQITPRGLD